jgi:hypothetical protein
MSFLSNALLILARHSARRPALCTNEGMNPAIDVVSMAFAMPVKKQRPMKTFCRSSGEV